MAAGSGAPDPGPRRAARSRRRYSRRVIVRATFDEVHERTRAALAEPGDWLDAAARRELVWTVRASADCAVCEARAGAPSPGMAGVEHAPGAVLPAELVDVAHRVTRDNARLARAWAETVIAKLGAGPYTETVGIAASARRAHRGASLCGG